MMGSFDVLNATDHKTRQATGWLRRLCYRVRRPAWPDIEGGFPLRDGAFFGLAGILPPTKTHVGVFIGVGDASDVFDIAYRDMPDTPISLRGRLDRDRAGRYAGCGG